MAENGLSNQLETYPPKKYFHIKEQGYPEDYPSKNHHRDKSIKKHRR